MRLKTRILLACVAVVMTATLLVWHFAGQRGAPAMDGANPTAFNLRITNHVAPSNAALKSMFAVIATNPPNAVRTNKFAYRLTNTQESLDLLVRNDRAVLLRNAFIDTSLPQRPEIPKHLKSEGDPGSYVVQVRGAITQVYRDWLEKSGAKIVSYIPNNAFLIRADAATAQMIGAEGGTQAVLPFEPYYKFDSLLLPLAVEGQPSPYEQLNVVAFPGQATKVKEQLEKMGGQVTGEPQETLLGPVFPAKVPANGLPALAQIPEVHMVGVRFEKKIGNDLSRVKLRVSTNTTIAPPASHYGAPQPANHLTGDGVIVGVNDTGADVTHRDLSGRVTGPAANLDFDGHGTHVIGSLLGNASGSINGTDATTNALGSTNKAYFTGIAPIATAYVQDFVGPDTTLQTNTALQNIRISNNSWGYGNNDYDIFAASYDAAVRDSLPGRTGEQEVAYVFAAGNNGGGSDNGLNGLAGSILSPATAKNVISVGASDQLRFITNSVCRTNTVVTDDGMGNFTTNTTTSCDQPWLGETDSDNEVAPFSSRGNVGIGVEGISGRFKPDVIAPGAMVVSARSGQYNDPLGSTNFAAYRYNSISVAPGATNLYALNIPAGAVAVLITNVPNLESPTNPLPPLLIDVAFDAVPTSPPEGTNWVYLTPPTLQPSTTLFYSIANPSYSNGPVVFDLVVRLTYTNDIGNYFDVLRDLNAPLKDGVHGYRYESGTSMAAPHVSGMLALIQEYLAKNFSGMTSSPALMKALIINGARSLSTSYNLDSHAAVNHQGWGIASISNSIPAGLSGAASTGPMRFYDQNVNNALATGGEHTYQITVPASARSYPLRLSLVWTDPPGNPISSVKLVNDLNLMVTGSVTRVIGGQPRTSSLVWVGNNFPPGSDFTAPIVAASTDPNTPVSPNVAAEIESTRDAVNNVENIYIAPPLATNYTVTVKAHRVNVNSLNSHSNSIAQDYALVISSGNVGGTNVNLGVTGPTFQNDAAPRVAAMMRGASATTASLMNQRVGANSPFVVSTNGSTNQWSFFVYTNVPTANFDNVLIVTFMSPNLSLARYREADIDMYVRRSTEGADPVKFTNELDATEISLAQKSTLRGGTEFVLYTNAQPNEVFYVGVKSEDQQAATFGILAASSDKSFGGNDGSNNIVREALVLPMEIPDGTPESPKGTTNLFAFVPEMDVTVRRIYVTNSIFHEQAGDTIGILSHQDLLGDGTTAAVVLNNHRNWEGLDTTIYDDSNEGDFDPPIGRPPDGPGTLRSFAGHNAFGQWNLSVSDNALNHTGFVDRLTVVIEPSNTNDSNVVNITRTIPGFRWLYAPVNVPFDAFNMEICLSDFNPQRPLDLYVKQGDFPNQVDYDYYWQDVPPTNGCHDIGLGDSPPLSPGRWFVGVYNPNAEAVKVTLRVFLSRQSIPGPYFTQFSTNVTSLAGFDDAVTNSTIFWTNHGRISDMRVGLRLDHERPSDLVFHLRSPTGRRLLLMENRGRDSAQGVGANISNYFITNLVGQVFFDGFEFSPAPATYGTTVSGWNVLPPDVDSIWSGPPLGARAHTGTNFVDLNGSGPGGVRRDITLTPGKLYRLSWAYTRNPDSIGNAVPEIVVRTNGVDMLTNSTANITNSWTNLSWRTVSMSFVAGTSPTPLEFASTTPGTSGVLLDSVRIEEMQVITNNFLYTTFTENTNLTVTPIKFGQPPFTNSPNPNSAVILDDGFELETVGFGYGAGSVIKGGWLVEAGDVDIIQPDPSYLIIPPDTGTNCLDINGFNSSGAISHRLATVPGVTYELSFAYLQNSALVAAAPTATVQLRDNAQVISTLDITASNRTEWFHTSVVFTAISPDTKLFVQSTFPGGGGVLFDTFLVKRSVSNQTDVTDGFFLPEEPIKPFFGFDAYGEWTLEIWDNRLGPLPSSAANKLLSWKLEMTFAATNPPLIALTNGIPYTNIIEGSNVLYFVVNSPCNVGFITNTLTNITMNGGIDLIFNQFVLPTNGPGDIALLFNVLDRDSATLIMGTPPLTFPNRYYLKVQNTDPATTNRFSLDVGIFCDTNVIIQLTNNAACLSSTVAGSSFQDYRFTTTPSDTQVVVEVTMLSGNVDMYLSLGTTPPTTCTMTPSTDCSANPGTNDEIIVLDKVNNPVLPNAFNWTWAVRVYNNETTNVGYCIRITTIQSSNVTQILTNTLYLTNSVGYADYYVLDIPPCPDNLVITLGINSGDVDLYVRNDRFPTTADYQFRSATVGGSVESVPIDQSTNPLLTAGTWYISVVHPLPNFATVAADYDIYAQFNTGPCPDGPKLSVSAASFTGDGFNLNWTASPSETYQVQYSDTLPANWQNVGGPVTSDNGQFHFRDDGSQTGGVGVQRFYRLLRLP